VMQNMPNNYFVNSTLESHVQEREGS
jgi:hypothetical protein